MSGIHNQSDSAQAVNTEVEKLNKTEQSGNSKDFFAVYQQNIKKFIDDVKQIVPKYHQSITNVQQECLNVCGNVITNAITLQKEYVRKLGLTSIVPEASIKIMSGVVEQFAKVATIQNQIPLAAIDATQQNIKTFNDNAKAFSDINRNILESWFSTFTFSRNN